MAGVKSFKEFMNEGKTFEGLSCEMQAVNIQQMLLVLKETVKAVYGDECCDGCIDKAIAAVDKVKKICCKKEKAGGVTKEEHEAEETPEHEAAETEEFEAGEEEEMEEIEEVEEEIEEEEIPTTGRKPKLAKLG